MSAAHTDKIILIFCEYKKNLVKRQQRHHLRHLESLSAKFRYSNQTNIVILPDPIFFKNKYPTPTLIQKNLK